MKVGTSPLAGWSVTVGPGRVRWEGFLQTAL